MTLGERIAYYRGKLGLSQGELAEQLGVEPAEASQALGASQQPLSLSADEAVSYTHLTLPTNSRV